MDGNYLLPPSSLSLRVLNFNFGKQKKKEKQAQRRAFIQIQSI